MKLNHKIFLYFGTFTVFIVLLFFSLNYYIIQDSLHERARRDLLQMVESVNTSVGNMLDTSIRNYLRGLVEQDMAYLRLLNRNVLDGRMTLREAKDLFQLHVNEQKFGESGYIAAVRQQGGRLFLDIHPFRRGEDCSTNEVCREWAYQKEGYTEYEWQNPGDEDVRKKVSYLMYFEPWNWIVGATSYKEEFTQLVKLEDLDRFVSSYTFLDKGYFFVLDDDLTFLIHPEMKGLSAQNMRDAGGNVIAREIIKNPGSFYYYDWKNPSEESTKKKFAYAKLLENFNWYLAATGYEEDVTRPVSQLMRISYTLVILIAFFLACLIVFFSRGLSEPLDELIKGIQAFYRDKKVFRMKTRSVTEIEAVGHSIENMTQILATAEQEKKEILDLLDSIINSMPTMLVCIDNDEKIILWNDRAAEYTGFSDRDAMGRPIGDIFSEFKESLAGMQQQIKTRPFSSTTCQVIKESGVEMHFRLTMYPLHSGLQSAVIKIDDISEQVHMEEAMLQSHKMESIGTLAGGIAHDFNNILSAIIGYTELSQMEISDQNNVSDYLDKIVKAGTRAKHLVQQILTFSRQAEQESRPVPVSVVINEALKLLKASLPSTIEIRQNIVGESLVMGDPTQVHQILMNLCTNAAHAMQENGGVLTVSLVNLQKGSAYAHRYPELERIPHMHLAVGDTGSGIPPGILERIFDPFFTTKEKGQGTGMGLSVVHGIVNSLRGIIDVKSEPGEGTWFNIFLPLVQSDVKEGKKPEELIPRGSERILFVDDEPTLVEIGKKTLEGLGYQVTTRSIALEALELFKRSPGSFDLVITDRTMPQMTGERLAREMVAVREDIPILLCTGFSSGMTEEEAKKIGIRGVLLKPVVRSKIAKMIRSILDNEQMEGQYEPEKQDL